VRLRKALKLYVRHVIALAAMVLIAGSVSLYILSNQRLRMPWEDVHTVYAEFYNADAVTPGQGQTVNVAGVKVGEIGEVKLERGRAVVRLDLTSPDLGPVYRNAHMLLRPKTGLEDMAIALDPGTPDRSLPDDGRLADGDRLPVWNTRPDVESDEVLSALDADTRAYLTTLANAGGQGLRGRAPDLRAILRASQPTFAHTRRVMGALADRRAKVRRLVTNLRLLTRATADQDRELAGMVDSATAVFETIAEREAALGQSIERAPGALAATNDALRETRALTADLGPALHALRPTVRELGSAANEVRPLLRDATPVVRDDLRPLVREATPLVRRLRPSVDLVNESSPDLNRSVEVLDYVANELGFNPPGSEEGYLFWTAWFFHNAASILSIEDAHGVAWRGLVMIGCSSVGQAAAANPALEPLTSAPVCPSPGPTAPVAAKRKAGK
jgi:phospholipid/cholesterol/gamma-HCH transport system substrate-binding protein